MERTITITLYGEPVEVFDHEFDEGMTEDDIYHAVAEYIMSGIDITVD